MSVKLRLARAGAKKNPFYRVVVTNSRSPRDGRFLEQVGIYDPKRQPAEVRFEMERVDFWLNNGALPTDTVAQLFRKTRIESAGKGAGQGSTKA